MPFRMKIILLFSLIGLSLLNTNQLTSASQVDYEFDEGVFSGELIEEPIVESPWSGTFAAGLNGKTGNSENLDINATLNLARDTDFTNTTLLASYFYASNDVATVTDRVFAQARQERKFSNNPKLSVFAQAAYEWDRFKNFDYRIALHGGIGYEVYKLDDRFLKTRFGAGASREVGGEAIGGVLPNDDWIPELQFGADWERNLTDRVRLYATVDYYPNVSDFGDYRLNTLGGVEYTINERRDINLRLFGFNRYDSTPAPGNVANDLDYGAALSIGF